MKIKQGTILPTTGIGTGYILLLIYAIFAWNIGLLAVLQNPFVYILLLVFTLMQFSYKDFIIDTVKPECFTIQYRLLFFIAIRKVKSFKKYDVFVIRTISKSYNVMQSGTGGLTTANNKEEYLAIVGREKTGKETFEICKESKSQLDKVIKIFITPLAIPVFKRAPKKGYEYNI